jgi:hypothetical protein
MDLARKKPLWSAMSEVFVDSEIDYSYIASRLRGHDRDCLSALFFDDVAPVCGPNMMSVIPPVWDFFDDDWLYAAILARQAAVQRLPRWRYRVGSAWRRWIFKREWRAIEAELDKPAA